MVKNHYQPMARQCPPQADTSAVRAYMRRLQLFHTSFLNARLVLQRDFWGILKGSLFLEVKPNVSHGRCHRRSVASSKPTGGAAPSLERGGLPSRRTGGLPPALCAVVLPT